MVSSHMDVFEFFIHGSFHCGKNNHDLKKLHELELCKDYSKEFYKLFLGLVFSSVISQYFIFLLRPFNKQYA